MKLDTTSKAAHYQNFAVQPLEIAIKNKMHVAEHGALKYIMRYPYKGQAVSDLEKCILYIDVYYNVLNEMSHRDRLDYLASKLCRVQKLPTKFILHVNHYTTAEQQHVTGLLVEQRCTVESKKRKLEAARKLVVQLLEKEQLCQKN